MSCEADCVAGSGQRKHDASRGALDASQLLPVLFCVGGPNLDTYSLKLNSFARSLLLFQ